MSVSIGVPAIFLWGGSKRDAKTRKVQLEHGDVVVWGAAARMNFHGIEPLRHGVHALTGDKRFNLTFRKSR